MLKKQIVEFVLKNWKALALIGLLLVLAGKFRYDYKQLELAYQTTQDSHKAQIEGLKQIHAAEIEEKQLLMESFLESIAQIEEEYELSRAELEKERRKKKERHIRNFTEDKETLIKDIEDTFGFEYVP
jgi:lipoate-protein ligase A